MYIRFLKGSGAYLKSNTREKLNIIVILSCFPSLQNHLSMQIGASSHCKTFQFERPKLSVQRAENIRFTVVASKGIYKNM